MSSKKSTKDKKISTVQSVIFGKNWKIVDARKWLKTNNHVPIEKVIISKKTKRSEGGSKKFIIRKEKDFDKDKKLGFRKLGNSGISIIVGTLK